jgi:hypothetical protein
MTAACRLQTLSTSNIFIFERSNRREAPPAPIPVYPFIFCGLSPRIEYADGADGKTGDSLSMDN